MIFLLQPVDPFEPVDPEYEMRNHDYSPTNVSIQDATSYGGGYVVNRYGGEGADFWMEQVRVCKTLDHAKAVAVRTYLA